jgi:protein-S-isoprenylcysteine O-methyltransferase Ste14
MPIYNGHLIHGAFVNMKKITPPTLMLICLLGMIALRWLVPLGAISSWILLIFGIGFIVFGLVMGLEAESQFRRNHTTVDPVGVSSKLVTDGWFKYSRNPMYLSFVLVLIGAWFTLGSISPLLGVLIFIFFTQQWYIFPEEKRLIATFGNDYGSYQMRTRRWL